MIVYLDRDGLLRLYLRDDGRRDVQKVIREAQAVATTAIGYPWLRAWLAAACREQQISATALRAIVARLDLDWTHLVRVPATDAVLRSAADLAERWALGGRLAVELASALVVRHYQENDELSFVAFDRRLIYAAREEGLNVIAIGGEGEWL